MDGLVSNRIYSAHLGLENFILIKLKNYEEFLMAWLHETTMHPDFAEICVFVNIHGLQLYEMRNVGG